MRVSLTSLDRAAPYLCLVLVVLSIAFPSKDLRTVRALRSDFESLRSDYASLRDEHSRTLAFIRDYDWSSLASGATGSAPGDAPDGAPPASGRVASGCSYTRCYGVDGVRRGADTWLVGDASPWGVVSDAYRGGFVANGVSYSYFNLTEDTGNDK